VERGIHTAIILKSPIKDVIIPPAMTTRHIGRPKFCTLVAPLLRLPKMLKPSTIIDKPRKTKPHSGLSMGQLRAKYERKMEHSETMRKRPMELEMKCDTPSKKKNLKSG
jgi:hypothetical protein